MCRPGLFGQASGLRVSNTDRQAPASSAQAPPSPWPLGKAWQQQAWCSVRSCAVSHPAYVALYPCACVACRIQGSMLATQTTAPPWHQPSTNNGGFGLFSTMPHEHGVVPSPACVAPCACAFRSMSHAEKAWQLRAPRRMCPFACSRRTPSLAPHSVTMTKMLHVLMQHKLTEMLHARCVCHTRHILM